MSPWLLRAVPSPFSLWSLSILPSLVTPQHVMNVMNVCWDVVSELTAVATEKVVGVDRTNKSDNSSCYRDIKKTPPTVFQTSLFTSFPHNNMLIFMVLGFLSRENSIKVKAYIFCQQYSALFLFFFFVAQSKVQWSTAIFELIPYMEKCVRNYINCFCVLLLMELDMLNT